VDRTVVAAGLPIALRWTASNSDRIYICALGMPAMAVDGRPGRGTLQIHAERSGPIRVVAWNPGGQDVRTTPPITVFDPASVPPVPVLLSQLAAPIIELTPPVELTDLLSPLPLPFPPVQAAPPAVGGGRFVRPASPAADIAPPLFDEGPLRFPFDISAIMTGTGTGGDGGAEEREPTA
jgi:hypothetical protein